MRFMIPCLWLACTLACRAPAGPKADLVFRGGKIVTLDPARPSAETLAITGERISAVGNGAQVDSLIGPSTRVIDLKGARVVPGFIESHGHFLSLGESQMRIDLVGTASPEEIAAKVRQAASEAPGQAWILGRGWDQNDWAVKEFPSHQALDQAAADRPVYLTRVDGHAGWANAKAMEMAGVSRKTKDPEGGEIIRDRMGNPTGVFIDRAQSLITSKIPEPGRDEQREAFRRAQQACLQEGITSFHDAGAGEEDIAIYREALTRGDLQVRLFVMLSGSNAQLLDKYFSQKPEISPFLTIRAVKLVSDGALGSRGAALLEDYADRPGWKGLMILPEEEIYKIASRAITAGYQVNVHAIGDRANREVLNAFEKVFKEHPEARDPRFRIEHAQILDQADIPRFAALGVIASMQGVHATSDMPWVPARIGPDRAAEGAYVWQKLFHSGARIANGTDAPVERLSALECFYASITRQDRSSQPEGGWYPGERMSREEALRSYTLDAAYAAFEEKDKGSLETGKLADLAVLSKDILSVAPPEILETEVLFTVIGGKVVHERR